MKHIDEETLELYILESDDVADRRAEIASHVKECAACAALLKEIEEYYTQVQDIHQERARATSQALTVRSMAMKVPTYTEFGPLSQIRKTWPAQAMLFVIRHPYTSVTSLAAVFVAALLFALQLTTIKDRNPAYARAKDEFLVAYNKQGQELWRKHVGSMYDAETLRGSHDPHEYIATIDVDGDGRQEVVGIFSYQLNWPNANAVMCYSADGTTRWSFAFHRNMTFGAETFSDEYHPLLIMAGDFDKDGKVEIVVTEEHMTYYPMAIVRLNGATGEVEGEYWHSGSLPHPQHKDFNGDGIEELYFPGENNGFNKASLLVLDPRRIRGHSPAPPEYTPANVPQGEEQFYALFPRNDFVPFSVHKRNKTAYILFEGGTTLTAWVRESVDDGESGVLFQFDQSMTCQVVTGSDRFVTLHRKFEAEGKLTKKLDGPYYEELRQGVQYWDGEKFVNTPTMNTRYLEAVGQLAKK
jgi:hypothetical protein